MLKNASSTPATPASDTKTDGCCAGIAIAGAIGAIGIDPIYE